MKKAVLILVAVALGFTMSAQTTIDASGVEIFHIDSLFEDSSHLMFTSKVVEVPGADQAEIKRRILNYAGFAFRDLSKVLVSESDDQLVLNYIESASFKSLGTPTSLKEYVRLVIQIKEGRFRLIAYDDGNVFIPGTYSKTYSSPSVAARSNYFTNRFGKDGIAKNKGMSKPQFQMIQSMDIKVNATINAFAEAGLVPTTNESIAGGSSNW